MTRKTITHPPLAVLADCMAAIDELDTDQDQAWVLAALNGRYAKLGKPPVASFAGGPHVEVGTQAQDGQPARAEP